MPRATGYAADPRNRHFWDTGGRLMGAYASVLRLDTEEWPEDAWDVYFVFGPEARWTDEGPPPPDFWMHQLRVLVRNPRPEAPFLDAEVFAEKVVKLLSAERRSSGPPRLGLGEDAPADALAPTRP